MRIELNNILAVRTDRFGEFLLNIPAFRALKESFPDSKLTLMVNPYVYELAKCISCVDEVITWENKKRSFSELLKLSRELKDKRFGISVIFNPSREFNLLTFLAGIPTRVGYDRKWGFLLTKKIKDEKCLEKKHEVDYNLELAGLIGAKTENKSLFLNIDSGIIDNISKEIGFSINNGNFIALHPWTSDPVKQWPLENFLALAKKIAEELKINVLIVGGKQEEQESFKLFKSASDRIVNITGKTRLTQLAAILKMSQLLISGDSGPVHLACAVDTRVVAIFRNDIPGKTSKRWGPWGKNHIVIEKNNLSDISVNEVLNRVKEALLNK